MHKRDLIQRVANEAGVAQGVVAQVLDHTLGLITDEVAAGRKVVITGFGTFERRSRQARRGVHPRTGEIIVIPDLHTPGFTAGSTFSRKVQRHGVARQAEPVSMSK